MPCRKCHRETPPDALYCPYCGVSVNPTPKPHKPRTRPNGSGTAFKRGKTWTARVVIGWKLRDGMKATPIWRTKGGFKTKKEALEYCPTLINSPKNPKKLTMQQIYDAWLVVHEPKVGRSTIDGYKSAWRYFTPLHNMTFANINLDDLQECVNDCPCGKRTKENMKGLAVQLMKYALPRHQTDMNYAQFIDTGKGVKGTRPAFTKEHVELIRQRIGITPYADYVYALIYTGFRPTELFGLTKDDYRDGILYGGIKTEAGKNRAVPVSPKIKSIVDRLYASNSDWMFPRNDGTQMTLKYFRDTYFYVVLADAGIQPLPTQDKPAYYVPYSCRHTFANMLKDVPGSDKDKAGLIGHEDYKTTQKHYQTAEIEALKAIVDKL